MKTGETMQVLLASHNAHKKEELNRILEPLGFSVVNSRDLGITLPDVEETGKSFEENALLKAESACRFAGIPAVADDSGLMVDALDGAPGIYSARFAGEDATDHQRMQKLLKELDGVPADKRSAHFVCSVCCLFPDGRKLMARGELNGRIAFAPQGEDGFGYDPIFLVDEPKFSGKTAAQLTAAEKDSISHRGKALRQLARLLQE